MVLTNVSDAEYRAWLYRKRQPTYAAAQIADSTSACPKIKGRQGRQPEFPRARIRLVSPRRAA
jgi:hypothetical protein